MIGRHDHVINFGTLARCKNLWTFSLRLTFFFQALFCWLLCFLCFMSLVSFTGSYTEDEPILAFWRCDIWRGGGVRVRGGVIGLIYDVSLWSRLIGDHDIYHWLLTPVLSACMRHIVAFTMWGTNNKQWLDEVFVISRIIKVDVSIMARLKRILCNLWTPRLSIDWHHQPLCQVSVDSRWPYWLTVGWHVNQYVGLHLTDMAVSVSANVSFDMSTLSADLSVNMSAFSQLTINQHISQHVDWESGDRCQRRDRPRVSQYVNRSTDMATESWLTYQPTCRLSIGP